MASFELLGAHEAAASERDSWAGKYLPLYVAGLVAGFAVAIGIVFATPGGEAVTTFTPAPFESLVSVPAAETGAGGYSQPDMAAPGATLNTFPELPFDLLTGPGWPGMTMPQAVEATAPALAPAAPALPTSATPPVATAPAAPAAPAVVPVAEAPVAAPAASTARPNFHVPEPAAGGTTDLEQRLLAGINGERASAGLAPYVLDAGLSRIARVRVQQLVDQDYFGHTDPFGYSMYTELLAHFGYASYAWAGENLALNNYGAAESPERAVAALMRSPTHRANILAGDFLRVGVGELTTADGRHFFAMIFLG